MTAPVERVRWLAVALLSLTSAACKVERDLCDELHEALQRCGLPPAAPDCSGIDAEADAYLVDRLDALGCDGIAGPQDAVDPRICELADWPCPPALGPEPGEVPTKNPVVLVGGIDDSALFDWNPRVLEAAAAVGGTEVHHVRLTPWASVTDRSFALWSAVEGIRAGRDLRVNLVCYAVGGLDCRFLVSEGGLFEGDPAARALAANAVASITTIATPHRGTLVADAALSALESEIAREFLAALVGVEPSASVPSDGALAETLSALTLTEAAIFNLRVPDAPEVAYQSWAGVSHVLAKPSPSVSELVAEHCVDDHGEPALFGHPGEHDAMSAVLWATAPFASAILGDQGGLLVGPADGMVSVPSARWGRFRGCVPADHYDVIGQIGHTTLDPLTGFDAPRFVAQIVSDLAAEGL